MLKTRTSSSDAKNSGTIARNSVPKVPSSAKCEVEEQVKKIRQSFLKGITSLVFILEAKNEYSKGHSQRVSDVAVAIAEKLGMPQNEVEQIRIAGLVHDIGKVGISEMVLNKKDQLTKEEFRHIASHSVLGERILKPIVDDKEILAMVRHHHEHYDGTGYPDGLTARNIPVGARILAIADAYDAMTSRRPYRKVLNSILTYAELKKHAGIQFDPIIVNAFFETQKQMVASKDVRQAAIIYS